MKQDSKKRIYSSPLVTVVNIDQEISLVMMSNPPIDPPLSAMEQVEETGPSPSAALESTLPSQESNPFGGSSPDYPE